MKNLILRKMQLVLEQLAARGSVTINGLSEELDIPLPTLSRLISDMTEMKLVEKTDYFHITPAAGLIRMGECAKKNAFLVRTAVPILRNYAGSLQMNSLLAGFDENMMFEIFSNGGNAVWSNAIWDSGLALVLMHRAKMPLPECRKFFQLNNPASSDTDLLIFEREMEQIENQQMLFRTNTMRQWSCSLPFIYRDTVYGFCIYGKAPDLSRERFSLDCSLVLSRINSALNGE